MTALVETPTQTVWMAKELILAAAIFRQGHVRAKSSNANAARKDFSSANRWMWLRKNWFSLPQVFRYFVSGNLANVALFFLERGVRYSMEGLLKNPVPNADSISYFSAYVLHIVVQHGLHAILVYGYASINTRSKYLTTLFGTYQALCVSAVGSTMLNSHLINIGWDRNVSFVVTLIVFSCLNYLWISYVVKQANKSTGATLVKTTTKRRGGVSERPSYEEIRGGYVQFDWGKCFYAISKNALAPTP